VKGFFNIRVYGIIINDKNEILLADEERFGERMTKFPGGGLHYGEGTIDCLKRESIEEFGQEIEVLEHFYTTDFFQESYFHKKTQIISIYYRARFTEKENFRISTIPFDFQIRTSETISFRYKKITEIKPDELTFPIDRIVVEILTNHVKF
jgi:8-oxo-dGTP diphosphatase